MAHRFRLLLAAWLCFAACGCASLAEKFDGMEDAADENDGSRSYRTAD